MYRLPVKTEFVRLAAFREATTVFESLTGFRSMKRVESEMRECVISALCLTMRGSCLGEHCADKVVPVMKVSSRRPLPEGLT